ncbi:hypothetical protein ACH5RR_024369 [Cinchona calisaya]|uniref:Gag-pol polyprotein n=1 Tax=Cinchona calisaya TaxID=153742 RepID=A0ABD2Z0M9_9GENT
MANNTVGNSREMKAVISYVIPMTTKITEHKLNGRNYLDWSKTVRVYLRSIDKDDHLIDEPLSDDAVKKAWLREDARIFLQIRNSIDTEDCHMSLMLLEHRFFPIQRLSLSVTPSLECYELRDLDLLLLVLLVPW